MLDVASATPSMTPMTLVFTPSTFARNNGRMFSTISLDTSMKKLVALTAHTLRGKLRTDAFFSGCGFRPLLRFQGSFKWAFLPIGRS